MNAARKTAITRRNAIELTISYLRRDEDLGVKLGRLGLPEVVNLALHMIQAMATVMEDENGGRDAAIESLQRQLYEANAHLAETDT